MIGVGVGQQHNVDPPLPERLHTTQRSRRSVHIPTPIDQRTTTARRLNKDHVAAIVSKNVTSRRSPGNWPSAIHGSTASTIPGAASHDSVLRPGKRDDSANSAARSATIRGPELATLRSVSRPSHANSAPYHPAISHPPQLCVENVPPGIPENRRATRMSHSADSHAIHPNGEAARDHIGSMAATRPELTMKIGMAGKDSTVATAPRIGTSSKVEPRSGIVAIVAAKEKTQVHGR